MMNDNNLPLHERRCANDCEFAEKAIVIANYGMPDQEWLYRCTILKRLMHFDNAMNYVGCYTFSKNGSVQAPQQQLIVPAAQSECQDQQLKLACAETK